MTSLVAKLDWSQGYQWDFFLRSEHDVLELWETTGEVKPKRIYAWALDHTENFQQVLLVLLQKFHRSVTNMLPQVVFAILAVQNAFARVAISAEAQPDS